MKYTCDRAVMSIENYLKYLSIFSIRYEIKEEKKEEKSDMVEMGAKNCLGMSIYSPT